MGKPSRNPIKSEPEERNDEVEIQTKEEPVSPAGPIGISVDVIEENEKMKIEVLKEAEAEVAAVKKKVVKTSTIAKSKGKLLIQLLSKSKFYIDYLKRKVQNQTNVLQIEQNADSEASCSKDGDLQVQFIQQCYEEDNTDPKKTKSRKRRRNEDDIKIEEAGNEQNSDTLPGNYEDVIDIQQPLNFEGGKLRDYQLLGLNWLRSLYEHGVNGILADEMGLGKTAQIIALICFLIEKKCKGPFLIIGPLSTMPNWIHEFERFAPKVPVVLYHGSAQKREEIASSFEKVSVQNGGMVFPIILTTYEVPLRDTNFFTSRKWAYMVIDEGHRLKNYKCQLARVLRGCASENRLLLTGTPLQNNLEELWSLLNFLLPEIFDDLGLFEAFLTVEEFSNNEYIIEKEAKDQLVTTLHMILKPFLLRRLKSDVQLDIPAKKEVLVYAPMSKLQWDLYKATVDRDITLLQGENKKEPETDRKGKRLRRSCTIGKRYSEDQTAIHEDVVEKPKEEDNPDKGPSFATSLIMQSPAIQLKKIANHPYLVKMPLIPGTKSILVNEDLISSSGKFLILDALLPKLKERGHKVLLFCTMTMLLDLVEEYVILRDFKYVRLDGRTMLEDRTIRIRDFNCSSDIFIFLISTRAGGLGVNLTAADTVIIFDSDWNPQQDLQAQDRCHRIGQTKPVVVYRLVTEGTIDERIVECASRKRRLEKLIIHKDKFKTLRDEKMVSLSELKELLESKDYQKIVHTSKEVLTSKQIDELLDRSDMSP